MSSLKFGMLQDEDGFHLPDKLKMVNVDIKNLMDRNKKVITFPKDLEGEN